MSLGKRAGCQTESKAFEKSIVARIFGEPCLCLQWDRIRSGVDRPGQKPAWRGERMNLDSRVDGIE